MWLKELTNIHAYFHTYTSHMQTYVCVFVFYTCGFCVEFGLIRAGHFASDVCFPLLYSIQSAVD